MDKTYVNNEEAIEAWNGVLFDRFVEFRHLIVEGLKAHGDEALRWRPPPVGARVLDIGCGFGDTSLQIAEIVGPEGSVLGVDAAERFTETATREAAEAGVENVSFRAADVEVTPFDEVFDQAFSRMGTMFFANPVAALRNVRQALVPGGLLCMVVWRQKADNVAMYRAEQAVQPFLDEPEEDTEEPTCGPGPFSMANADTTSGILKSAGFEEIELRRCDLPMRSGRDLDEAVDLVMGLGPAGEVIRLAGDQAESIRPQLEASVREVLQEFEGPEGLVAPTSTWLVSARAPRS